MDIMLESKTPMVARLFVCGVCLAAVSIGFAMAAPAQERGRSVDDVVAAALAQPHIEEIIEAELAAARAEVAGRTRGHAPTLSVEHHQMLGGAGLSERESTIQVEQRFDISAWRSRSRAALAHREAAIRSGREAWRLEVAHAVRDAFFRARYRQDRVVVVEAMADALHASVEATRARAERGDVSLLELRRLEQALATTRALVAAEGTELAAAVAQLQVWVPSLHAGEIRGALAPAPSEIESPAAEQRLPTLARLAHERDALRADAEAVPGSLARDWAVQAGYVRTHDGQDGGHGFVVGVGVPLDFRNPNRAELQRLRAEAAGADARLQLESELAGRREAAAQQRLSVALAALSELPPATDSSELIRLAEAAYAAGEGGVTELLGAHAGRTEIELLRIDVQWEARQAANVLMMMRAGGVPE